ncbi:hypothetical protein E5161_13050 [Cohnella pontilimi]|uniref:PepSY domain-containing protein n=1 Tax=Cohnella pontilimi TaxID=2564100 RepID=A0A4U0FB02_9BACL|nr:hypothetical protein [Cohnella pontilimi]TJY41344.1 hypothetical protein E5161_13050 [Cohnella pontilimi]
MSNTSYRRMAFRTLLLMFILLISVPLPSFAVSPATVPPTSVTEPPSALAKQVTVWVSELSKRQPFTSWKTAASDIQALGPGTHSWLVLLSANGKTVGYMVVQAAADGSFRLGEYGTGPAALFSETALKRTLKENGLLTSKSPSYMTVQKHYLHPFAAFWEVTIYSETYWLDAKTGELLPMNDKIFNLQAKKTPVPVSAAGPGVSTSWLKSAFDPYERLPWLTGEKPFSVQDAAKLQTRIRSKQHLRYVSEPFGDAILYALPVTGFQRWTGGRLDIALDMSGTRYIPLKTLTTLGRFYR